MGHDLAAQLATSQETCRVCVNRASAALALLAIAAVVPLFTRFTDVHQRAIHTIEVAVVSWHVLNHVCFALSSPLSSHLEK